jgi:hypothetical protein
MRFTYFRSEPRRLHARSPRSSASRGVSAPSALRGPVRNRNRDCRFAVAKRASRDPERGRLLVVQLSSLGGLDRGARIHDNALVSSFGDVGLTPDTGT